MSTQEIETQVDRLFKDAEKLGCDSPTAQMIVDSMNDVLDTQFTEIVFSLDQAGFTEASKALFNWKRLAHLKNQ